MSINWKVRLNNPTFWLHVAAAIIVPVFAHFGVNIDEIETWQSLYEIFGEALSNPAVVFAMAVSVWNLLIDPTTRGLSDSDKAMTYVKPN